MKTSPVAQKLQIKLQDKELLKRLPSPRRPQHFPTGPNRLAGTENASGNTIWAAQRSRPPSCPSAPERPGRRRAPDNAAAATRRPRLCLPRRRAARTPPRRSLQHRRPAMARTTAGVSSASGQWRRRGNRALTGKTFHRPRREGWRAGARRGVRGGG